MPTYTLADGDAASHEQAGDYGEDKANHPTSSVAGSSSEICQSYLRYG
ncbi:MAG: hypothetical protein ABSE84_33740 [Isosphaeraceae bacterium]